jgi:hypothetical protein
LTGPAAPQTSNSFFGIPNMSYTINNTKAKTIMWAHNHTFFPCYLNNSEALYEKMADAAMELIKKTKENDAVPYLIKRAKFQIKKIKEGITMYLNQKAPRGKGTKKLLEFLEPYNAIQRRSDASNNNKVIQTLADWVVSICVLIHFNVEDFEEEDGTGPFTIETPLTGDIYSI